jgi:CheY-like chemotaxis protein
VPMKSRFNLRKLCESLTKKFEKDSTKQNIIKLSVDDNIPKEFYGNRDVCEQLLREGYQYFTKNLVNGIIRIDIDKKSESTEETTITLKTSGSDNIQNSKFENGKDQISSEALSLIKKKFVGAKTLKITSEKSALIFQVTLQNIDSSINSENAHPLTGSQVLIAEDNEINAMVFSSFLEEWGCISSFAINGLEALQMAQENEYDLILMDIHMPVLNGIKATEKIREFNVNIPIIALTASDLDQDYNGAHIAGVTDYLVKPISNQLLHSVISKCLVTSDI